MKYEILMMVLAVVALVALFFLARSADCQSAIRQTANLRYPSKRWLWAGPKWRRAFAFAAPFIRMLDWLLGAPPNRLNNWDRVALTNADEGDHLGGVLSKRCDAAMTTRYLLVKNGTDEDHIAVAGAADTPYGVCVDETTAAEELVSVKCLSGCPGTIRVQTDGSGALVAGDLLIPAASGQVKKVAAAVGLQYIVGVVAKAPATTAGVVFEAIPKGVWYNSAVS